MPSKRTRVTLHWLLTTCIVVLLGAGPVRARCNGPGLITTKASPTKASLIWTEGWGPSYHEDIAYQTTPPVTSNFRGTFWSLGRGSTGIGTGDDSGEFDFVRLNDSARGFYYESYGGYFYGGELFTGWGAGPSDGCLFNAALESGVPVDGFGCTCLLLTDQRDGQGYFAIVSARPNANGNSFLNLPENAPIILRPVPRLSTPAPSLSSAATDISVSLSNGAWTDGIYEKDGCACGVVGFRVYQQVLPSGSSPPTDRLRDDDNSESGWELADEDSALTGSATPVESTSSAPLSCGEGRDVFLATSLVFDSGFEVDFLSQVSGPFPCAP